MRGCPEFKKYDFHLTFFDKKKSDIQMKKNTTSPKSVDFVKLFIIPAQICQYKNVN